MYVYICVWNNFVPLIQVWFCLWKEFWNVDFLVTEFSHPEVTWCSWQVINIQFLTSVTLYFWHIPLQTFSHCPPLGTSRLFQCTKDTLLESLAAVFFKNFFYKRLKNVNAISTSVYKQHQQQTLFVLRWTMCFCQDVKIQLLGDKHGAVSSCLTHAWTVKQWNGWLCCSWMAWSMDGTSRPWVSGTHRPARLWLQVSTSGERYTARLATGKYFRWEVHCKTLATGEYFRWEVHWRLATGEDSRHFNGSPVPHFVSQAQY